MQWLHVLADWCDRTVCEPRLTEKIHRLVAHVLASECGRAAGTREHAVVV